MVFHRQQTPNGANRAVVEAPFRRWSGERAKTYREVVAATRAAGLAALDNIVAAVKKTPE